LTSCDIGVVNGKDYTAEKRWEYLHLTPEILNAPDEVWVREGKGGRVNWQFIKYFDGRAITIRAEVPNGKEARGRTLEITSWYEAGLGKTKKEDVDATLRNGVLAKKMPA